MNADLRAPGDRYRVAIDVISAVGGGVSMQRSAEQGTPFWDTSGRVASEAGTPQAQSYMVVVDDICSLVLIPGENGLTVRWVRLLNAQKATIRARVIAGSGAPDWLPPESEYLILEGDARAAAAFKDQFIPLAGMAAERSWAEEETPLDLVAIAIGKSVARANAALARVQAAGGVALVSSITVRLALNQAELARGRMLVALARPGEGQTGQFVELTMTTVPGAGPDGEPDMPGLSCLPVPDVSAAAATGGQGGEGQPVGARGGGGQGGGGQPGGSQPGGAQSGGGRSGGVAGVFSPDQIAQAGQRILGGGSANGQGSRP